MSSESDSDIPEVILTNKVIPVYGNHIIIAMIYLQGKESISEIRRIRVQQDMEYLESIRVDREKELKRVEYRKRVEVCSVVNVLIYFCLHIIIIEP